jgi:hypothetical protein
MVRRTNCSCSILKKQRREKVKVWITTETNKDNKIEMMRIDLREEE